MAGPDERSGLASGFAELPRYRDTERHKDEQDEQLLHGTLPQIGDETTRAYRTRQWSSRASRRVTRRRAALPFVGEGDGACGVDPMNRYRVVERARPTR